MGTAASGKAAAASSSAISSRSKLMRQCDTSRMWLRHASMVPKTRLQYRHECRRQTFSCRYAYRPPGSSSAHRSGTAKECNFFMRATLASKLSLTCPSKRLSHSRTSQAHSPSSLSQSSSHSDSAPLNHSSLDSSSPPSSSYHSPAVPPAPTRSWPSPSAASSASELIPVAEALGFSRSDASMAAASICWCSSSSSDGMSSLQVSPSSSPLSYSKSASDSPSSSAFKAGALPDASGAASCPAGTRGSAGSPAPTGPASVAAWSCNDAAIAAAM
mmetsp:Transcript_14638/g.47843  ORF Transcript_14638/g.47843 Transcript_14638/m.47843 type:complete len:273 (+) Transcript_14638:689-1507(+)